MADADGDKSHPATPKRRQQARAAGHVPRSQDIGSAALLLGGVAILSHAGPGIVDCLAGIARQQLGGKPWLRTDADLVSAQAHSLAFELAAVLWPVFAFLLLAAVAVNLAQAGFVFLPEKLAPDASRINPAQGLSRLFSLDSIVRLFFGLGKVAIIVLVAYFCLRGEMDHIVSLAALESISIARYLIATALSTAFWIGTALLVLAILDYAYHWWKYEQDLRMTTQEVREELRESVGDPQLAARRKRAHREMSVSGLTISGND